MAKVNALLIQRRHSIVGVLLVNEILIIGTNNDIVYNISSSSVQLHHYQIITLTRTFHVNWFIIVFSIVLQMGLLTSWSRWNTRSINNELEPQYDAFGDACSFAFILQCSTDEIHHEWMNWKTFSNIERKWETRKNTHTKLFQSNDCKETFIYTHFPVLWIAVVVVTYTFSI